VTLRLDKENDIEVVRQAALILERENKRLVDCNVELTRRLLQAEGRDRAELQLEIARLEAKLEAARKRLFGASSEKRTKATTEPTGERAPQAGHGPRAQRELEIVEEVHTCAAAPGRARARWRRGSARLPRRAGHPPPRPETISAAILERPSPSSPRCRITPRRRRARTPSASAS
jgi:hypothetical protein